MPRPRTAGTGAALTTVHIDAEVHGRLAARTALGLGLAGLSPEPGRITARDST
ncbi:hypothetical protein HEP84_55395 [Streptomyces sp. RLB1-33]|nr:hypothetical protein [Streptomyces sp. RLB1-33]